MFKGLAEALGWITLRTLGMLACGLRVLVSSLVQSARSLAAQLQREYSQDEDEDG